jgi:hypothetical protein
MGWPNKSAIANGDTPPATGNVWGYDNFESDWSDCVELDQLMRTKLNKDAFIIICRYYLDGKWVMRTAARLHGCHHSTFDKKLGMAMAQLDYLLANKDTVNKPLQRLTV